MPYIKFEDRKQVDVYQEPNTAGDLNYYFTTIVDDYLQRKGLNYQNLNDCIGALEGAKLELYRRVAAPYEDKKIKENGDVYSV
jgi:hypothetical protein